MECYTCLKPIEDSEIRMFLDQNKKKQVCKKCWDKECEIRFSKTSHKQPQEVIKELTERFGRFSKAKELAETKEKR